MTLHKALPEDGTTADRSIRVFIEAVRRRERTDRRSGWPTVLLRAAALPAGIPPGRSRPEPPVHT